MAIGYQIITIINRRETVKRRRGKKAERGTREKGKRRKGET